jgi:hypothetical protein
MAEIKTPSSSPEWANSLIAMLNNMNEALQHAALK